MTSETEATNRPKTASDASEPKADERGAKDLRV
jgi:hypothetical protein